ncbi:MAG: hypothetical protein ABSA05_08120 [Opitutaceae bacterium]|jgi:hypothetical protein
MSTDRPFVQSWQWRYGFLAVLLTLFVWNLSAFPQLLHSHVAGRFHGIILSLMLIFNHVGAFCVPTGRFKTGFLIFAMAWAVFGCAYIFTRGFSGFL